jgi:hypothetical protein
MRFEFAGAGMTGDLARIRDQARELWVRRSAWASRAAMPRGWLIYACAWPLPFAGMWHLARGSVAGFLAAVTSLAMLVLAARWIRRAAIDGQLAPSRRFTRRATPLRGFLAIGLVGVATALSAVFAAGNAALVGLLQGAIASAGSYLVYRGVTAPEKTRPGAVPAGDRRLEAALAAAEERVIAIERAAFATRSAELAERLRRIAAEARSILDLVAGRPGSLGQMRRFFNVHLDGAQQVAARYARTHRWSAGAELEASYRQLLVRIEASFVAQRRRLVAADTADLDVLIEVLRQQLREEGFA